MILVRLLTVLVCLHIGMAFTQLSYNYFAADVYEVDGVSPWARMLEDTPFENLGFAQELRPPPQAMKVMNATTTESLAEDETSAIIDIFGPLARMGDLINGLLSFNYGVLGKLTAGSGFAFLVVLALRVVVGLLSVALAAGAAAWVFASGLLSSLTGKLILGGALGLTTITSILGALT